MKLQTASSVISFAKSLEDESARFYEGLAQRYTQGKDIFLSFAMENKKNIVQIERAYYGVITDAIEGCFAFNIKPDAYTVETTLVKAASYSDALGKAIELEEKIGRFYSDAAEQSKSLMADVPRAFTLIARKRSDRIAKLKSL
jgi:rubrerythrin